MLIYGKNVAITYLETPENINKIYLWDQFNDQKIKQLISASKIKPIILDKKQINQLASGNHQGIILDVRATQKFNLQDLINDQPTRIVMLDHIEDPHNFGAIIRTCEAAGIKYIVIPNKRSVKVDGIVHKTSAGTASLVKIIEVANLNDSIKKLQAQGYWTVGTAINADTNYQDFTYPEKTILIIGNEGKGLSPIIEGACDFLVKIPMYGQTNSLNASVAAGIIIFNSIINQE